MAVSFVLNGTPTTVADDRSPRTLLDALREDAGVTTAKDGCAPQGQCGCCTVLVDGRARVACVTPLRRVAGRRVETLEGIDPTVAGHWAEAFLRHGASQCGFCTPGIVMRLEDRRRRGPDARGVAAADVHRMLAAHLCRCTGWQGITEAAVEVLGREGPTGVSDAVGPTSAGGTSEAATRRATIETGGPQRIDRGVVLGGGGFAADTPPPEALVAVPDRGGEWVVAQDLCTARALAGRIQGRRSTLEAVPPLEVPDGDWSATLATSWIEPAYLEADASWCEPGGEPASPLANGGAFGGKRASPLPAVARRLADLHDRAVLALWSREDVVRHGPKRPPVAVGVRADGTGVIRVVATPSVEAAISAVAPGLVVEAEEVPGPPTSRSLRAAGWAEAFCVLVAADVSGPAGGRDGSGVHATAPDGGWARVEVTDTTISVLVGPGDPLDEVVLRSYATGAAHMAASWVCSEGLAVDPDGVVQDLTVRSLGILAASAMPPIEVRIDPGGAVGEPVAIGDAVFAATAAAVWRRHAFAPTWPLRTAVL